MVIPKPSAVDNASKAAFYRRYRPSFPRALLNHLLQRVKNGALLDLGCGTGRVTVPLAPNFRDVVAVDPDATMIDEGQKHAFEAGVTNIRWLVDRAEEFVPPPVKFNLITIGDAFHRLDQDLVLDEAGGLLADSGGIGILQSWDTLSGTEPWHRVVAEIVKQWCGGASVFSHQPNSPELYGAALRRHGLKEVETVSFAAPHMWTPGSVVGNLHSTSCCSKSALDDRADEFAQQVIRAVRPFEVEGGLPELLHFSYTFGRLG